MLELHGGLCLSFRGITEYLRGLVLVYEPPIFVGVQLLMVYYYFFCHEHVRG